MFHNGILHIIVSTLCFAIINLCVKYMDEIPTNEIVFFRSIITFIITSLLIYQKKIPFFGVQKNWLLVRGAAGATALTLFFYTIKVMPIATATTIQYLSPIFTILLAVLFFGDKVKNIQWILFIISFGGVLLVKGFDPRVSWYFLGLGVLSAFFSGIAYNAIIKCKNTDHPLTMVLYFPLVAIPVMGIWCLYEWKNPNLQEWFLLITAGVLTQIAQVNMTKALLKGKTSVIVPFKYLGTIYALIYGAILFNEYLSIGAIMGILLILAGLITNAFIGQKSV